MSDRVKLARDIAARTKPTLHRDQAGAAHQAAPDEWLAVHRGSQPERGGGRVPFTEEQLAAMRGGLTAEEFRWKLIRKFRKR